MPKAGDTSACELVGDFNLKTHYKSGVGRQVGGTDSVDHANSNLHRQYSSGEKYIPFYVGKTVSFNSYIADNYEENSAVTAEQAKQVASLLCGNKIKKVTIYQPNTAVTSVADLTNHLVENAPYHQIIHSIPFRNNLFTVVIPPYWAPASVKYPVLVNGFYSLNNNVFHEYGEGSVFFRLQTRLLDEGQRGFIGIMWNGGGATGSRTMNDLAYNDFNDFVGFISRDLGLDTDKAVSFGISRGGITALNLAAHPAVRNLKFAYVNAASPAIDAGYIGDLITPTIPALLFANDWSTGYLGSWRNSFRMPSGISGQSQHLINLVGTDNKNEISNRYSIISPDRIEKLKANQTAVYMELSSHDIIVPFVDQLRGLNRMIEQQVKIEARINYLVGHQEDDIAKFERIYRVLLALDKNQSVPRAANGFIDRKVLVENANRDKIFSGMTLGYAVAPLTVEVPRLVVPDAAFQVIVTGTPGKRYIMSAVDNGAPVPKTLDFTISSSGINIINLQNGDISGTEIYIDDIYEVDSSGAAQYKLQTRSSFAGSDQKLKISKLQSSYGNAAHFHGQVVNGYLGDNCRNCLLKGEFQSYGLLEVNRTPASDQEKLSLQNYLNARCAKGEVYENGVCKEAKLAVVKQVKCAAGRSSVTSADGKLTCSFSWSETAVGASPANITVLSGNLDINGTCENVNNVPTWKWSYKCTAVPASIPIQTPASNPSLPVPAPAPAQVSCAGGQHVVKSPSGKTTCTFQYAPKLPGQTQNIASATGNGEVKGLCLDDGRWQFTASCSDPATVSCPSGEQKVGNRCWFIWSGSVPGETQSVIDRNGTGSIFSGTCGADGQWKNINLPVNRCD